MCTMNITLSADDEVVARARRVAESLGTSLNQLIRDYLAELASGSDADHDVAEFARLSKKSTGDSGGWEFDRDELHARS